MKDDTVIKQNHWLSQLPSTFSVVREET